MRIIESPTSACVTITNLTGYRADAEFTIRLARVKFVGDVAYAVDIGGDIRYCGRLADALNVICSAIRTKEEQQQLLRELT